MAATHEGNLNNNNIFAGKNLSDNTKITSFYTLKALPPYQSPLNYFGANSKIDPVKKQAKTETGKDIIEDLFTNNMAKGVCELCKDPEDDNLEGNKVSNLVNKPRLNERYTDAWFLK